MLCHRVPLVKKKSLKKNLIENGLLEDFLKQHTSNPASKYFPKEAATLAATQPLENYMDVSAGPCRAVGPGTEDLAWRKEGFPGVLEGGAVL